MKQTLQKPFYVEIEDNQDNTIVVIKINSVNTELQAEKLAKKIFCEDNDITRKTFEDYGMQAMCLDLKEIDSNYLNNVMILDEEF